MEKKKRKIFLIYEGEEKMDYKNQSALAKKFHLQIAQKQYYPLLCYQYDVILGGCLTSFSKITGLVLKSSEITAVNEGGRNQPYLFRDSKKNIHTMVLEKGYGTIDLMGFCDNITDVTILLRNQKGDIVQAYSTSYAVVQEIKFSDLDASKTEILIQSMTIAYTMLNEAKDIKQTCSNLEKENINVNENVTYPLVMTQNKKSVTNFKNTEQNKKSTTKNDNLDFIKKQNQKAFQKQNKQVLELEQKKEQINNNAIKKVDFSV